MTIHFSHLDLSGTFDVARVGKNEVRLDNVPFLLLDFIGYRDIIEVDENPDGSLTFVRLSQRSGWQTHNFVLSHQQADDPLFLEVCKRADAAGAHWERIFGGLVFVCVPPGSSFDPASEFANLFGKSAS